MTEPDNPKDYEPPRHANLAAALAAFQAERPDLGATATARIPPKDGKSGYSYDYATLADVERATLPLLGAHGLAWHCKTTVGERGMLLVCALMHVSGEALESVFPLPAPNNPQAFGSLLTYFKRYALMMATGVSAGDDDDDAARATHGTQRGREEEPEQRRQEPREAGQGTRQGAADGYAWALATEELEKLPEIWTHVEAGGFTEDTPQPTRAAAIRKHFQSMEILPESEPGRQMPMATGTLAQIAAYRLIAEGWRAVEFNALERAVAADKAYMGLANQQPNFGRFVLSAASGGRRLGDWLATNAADLHRARNSDPEQTTEPPWVASADIPPGRHEQAPDVATVDASGAYDAGDAEDNDSGETPWYDRGEVVDQGGPAVLEGRE